jgi:interferon gamma-inducible protein 30
MKTIRSLIAISLLASAILADKPKIDVFVESLCPDCQGFIENSFKQYQTNESRLELADVTFFPYGNAKETFDGSKWIFTCQHGPNECYGNIIETCARDQLQKDDFNTFMVCLEADITKTGKDFNKSLANCLTNPDEIGVITQCAEGDMGNQLEHEVAQATPQHDYVPWVVVNGVHDVDAENQILDNMVKYLCKDRTDLPGCKTTGVNFLLNSLNYLE